MPPRAVTPWKTHTAWRRSHTFLYHVGRNSEAHCTVQTEQERKVFISSYTLPAKEPGTHEAIILDDCHRCAAAYTRSSAISSYSLDTNFWRFSGIGPTVMRTAVAALRSKTVVYGQMASYVLISLISSRNIKIMPDEVIVELSLKKQISNRH